VSLRFGHAQFTLVFHLHHHHVHACSSLFLIYKCALIHIMYDIITLGMCMPACMCIFIEHSGRSSTAILHLTSLLFLTKLGRPE
jgi:hypothetical protein